MKNLIIGLLFSLPLCLFYIHRHKKKWYGNFSVVSVGEIFFNSFGMFSLQLFASFCLGLIVQFIANRGYMFFETNGSFIPISMIITFAVIFLYDSIGVFKVIKFRSNNIRSLNSFKFKYVLRNNLLWKFYNFLSPK